MSKKKDIRVDIDFDFFKSDSQAYDFNELSADVKKYYEVNKSLIYSLLTLIILSMVSWLYYAFFYDLKEITEDNLRQFNGLKNLSLGFFSSISAASVIILLTDFSSKRSQKRGLLLLEKSSKNNSNEIINSLSSHSNALDEMLSVSFNSGLRASPDIDSFGKSPSDIFDAYLPPRSGTVSVISSSGRRWFMIDGDYVPQERMVLPLLMRRNVTLQIIIYSPLIEIIKTLKLAGVKNESELIKNICAIIKNKKLHLSSSSIAKSLNHQKDIYDRLNEIRDGKFTTTNKKFNINVMVSPEPPCSDYFMIKSKAVFAAYPMRTRTSFNAISVSVRDFIPHYNIEGITGEHMINTFQTEFDSLWEHALPFDEYYMSYSNIINKVTIDPAVADDIR